VAAVTAVERIENFMLICSMFRNEGSSVECLDRKRLSTLLWDNEVSEEEIEEFITVNNVSNTFSN
jgi:hypothetical protein